MKPRSAFQVTYLSQVQVPQKRLPAAAQLQAVCREVQAEWTHNAGSGGRRCNAMAAVSDPGIGLTTPYHPQFGG